MVRIVKRECLVGLVEQNYKDQGKNCFLCSDSNCSFCKKSKILAEELRKKI